MQKAITHQDSAVRLSHTDNAVLHGLSIPTGLLDGDVSDLWKIAERMAILKDWKERKNPTEDQVDVCV